MMTSVVSDLTADEQKHVRVAIVFLHQRARNWDALARALKIQPDTIYNIVKRRRSATASMAYRVARLLGSSIDDLISGRAVPADTCPSCGYVPSTDAKP